MNLIPIFLAVIGIILAVGFLELVLFLWENRK